MAFLEFKPACPSMSCFFVAMDYMGVARSEVSMWTEYLGDMLSVAALLLGCCLVWAARRAHLRIEPCG